MQTLLLVDFTQFSMIASTVTCVSILILFIGTMMGLRESFGYLQVLQSLGALLLLVAVGGLWFIVFSTSINQNAQRATLATTIVLVAHAVGLVLFAGSYFWEQTQIPPAED